MPDASAPTPAPIRVAVLGASGYGAREAIALLLRHPHVRITALTSRDESRPHLDEVHPSLRGRLDLRCEPFDADRIAAAADVAILGLPHKASMAAARPLRDRDVTVLDMSADYRLRDAEAYRTWYGEPHTDPAGLAEAVYGLPELHADAIAAAKLVAMPGCFPTGAVLGLAPLLRAGLIDAEGIVVDAKTGISGAGRTPKPAFHFPEANENLFPYGVAGVGGNALGHRHTPEIEQSLTALAGKPVEILFTPHLIPMNRGILSTVYATGDAPAADLTAALHDFYADAPFVRVLDDTLPQTAAVAGTNFCDVAARPVRGGRVMVFTAIDNLIKGTAGNAVQCLNLIHRLPQSTGLP